MVGFIDEHIECVGVVVKHLWNHHFESVLFRNIFTEFESHVQENTSLSAFHYLQCILAPTLNGDSPKTILLGILTCSVGGGNPDTPSGVTQDIFYLIVADTQRVIAVKVLMVFIGIELVQTPEGANPDMT